MTATETPPNKGMESNLISSTMPNEYKATPEITSETLCTPIWRQGFGPSPEINRDTSANTQDRKAAKTNPIPTATPEFGSNVNPLLETGAGPGAVTDATAGGGSEGAGAGGGGSSLISNALLMLDSGNGSTYPGAATNNC